MSNSRLLYDFVFIKIIERS